MCRQTISDSYFETPELLADIDHEELPVYDDGYQWFYEGRGGWWLYDKRASDEIEAAFKDNQRKCELLIAGYLYVIDFDKMLQYRRSEPQRQRRIKRDKPDRESLKGVAGLRRPGPLPCETATEAVEAVGGATGVTRSAADDDELENEVERDLAQRLEASAIRHDGYRETYL